MNEKQESSSQLNRALLRELVNWGKKPTSAEFQQRYNNHTTCLHYTLLSVLNTLNKNNLGCFFALLCVRVELHKKSVLEQCDLEQEMIYEELRRKKVAQDQTMERIKAQLLVSMFHISCTSLPDNGVMT